MIEVGSDFSGVGAFDQALLRLKIKYKTVFACDMDKYARQTYIHNYGMPDYYPENVYDREIPINPLDIYMSSPPCQSFSLAGKRKGEGDKRGILFYNTHEFIKKNNPRYFIIENVKGLLSDDAGKTFQRWLDFLGGKSVNGNPAMFPIKESANYHVYWRVLNAKDYGVPQNRERVFIIGIRDDEDNSFSFPKPFNLTKRLKDVLEENVDEKYFLSDKILKSILKWKSIQNPFDKVFEENDIMSCVLARVDGELHAGMKLLKIKSATKKGYETATEGDSINLERPDSETRRGRVGKGVAQTIDTSCQQGVLVVKHERTEEGKAKRKESLQKKRVDVGLFSDRQMTAKEQEYSDTILANANPQKEGLILIGAFRGRNPDNMSDRTIGTPTKQRLELNHSGTSNTITTVQKDNVVVTNYRIRRLTPRECFRLMDFPDTFTWHVSDSQAYKQAGNSIVVNVLVEIIKKLKL